MINYFIKKEDLLLWKSKEFFVNAFFSFSIFLFTLIINYYAVRIATHNSSSAVTDLILSSFKRIDTSIIHGTLSIFIEFLTLSILILKPRYFLFAFKSLAVLVVTRIIFINLTNLGIPSESVPIKSFYTFGGDLFFSGHVAFMFLLALIFWKEIGLRWFYIVLTLTISVGVLLGHYHYSIDVFAAPFIAYGIYSISKIIFRNDFNFLSK
ncbi:MAG: sphingomyelin synthase family protein [Candidatus Pacebacteria bacterium]|nr:sphingomyelin synthase family protein [Candidatus Paceibacterota bacterium]MCF7857663.1 sphingomyelin synthase family protein [Candidatus Paceibacterota bacterium]